MEENKKICRTCEADEEEVILIRCVICHKYYCEECRVITSGREFCSRFCGEYFFYSDPDEE